jgi:hypothetical protein
MGKLFLRPHQQRDMPDCIQSGMFFAATKTTMTKRRSG